MGSIAGERRAISLLFTADATVVSAIERASRVASVGDYAGRLAEPIDELDSRCFCGVDALSGKCQQLGLGESDDLPEWREVRGQPEANLWVRIRRVGGPDADVGEDRDVTASV